MVFLSLQIRADLENVTELAPASNQYEYFFQVKCNSCNEEHPKFISLNSIEEYKVSGGKHNTAHFVWRCGVCKRESSAKFASSSPFRPYTSDNGDWAPLLQIECRGLEFTGFDPKRGGAWKCRGVEPSESIFSDVSFEEGDWVDYDEKAAKPVGVSNLESKWQRA